MQLLQSVQDGTSRNAFLLQSHDGASPAPQHIHNIRELLRTRINFRSSIENREGNVFVTTELRGDQVGLLEGFVKGFGLRLVPQSRLG